MSTIISFANEPEQMWMVGNWAYRLLRADVVSQYPDNQHLAEVLERAEWYSHLDIAGLDEDQRQSVVNALVVGVTRILSGEFTSVAATRFKDDPRTISQYLDALPGLRRMALAWLDRHDPQNPQ